MADTTYTPIQRKFYQVAKLLVEIRLLAEKQGAAYRADNRLPIARSYENIASGLRENVGVGSLDTLVRILEHESSDFYKPELATTDEEVKESMTNLLRYVNSHRPEALARITEEYVMGNEKKVTDEAGRAERQKEWTEQFGDHSECPVCGTACEMLFVEE